jgi:hypothetical protein
MHLRTQIYKSNLPKILLAFLFLGLFSFYSNPLLGNNLSASPVKKIGKRVKQFDTLFCAQKPIAKIMTVHAANDSSLTYYYYHINDTSLLLSVKPIRNSKASTNQAQLYFHFEFPNIQMNADYKPKTQAKNVKEIVCEYELI